MSKDVIIKKYVPQSEAWLDARLRCVTATEIASLFGCNKSKSANQVMKDKFSPPQKISSPYLRAGRLLEPGVLIAMQEIGIPAKAADHEHTVMAINTKIKLSCSLDGKAEMGGNFYVVECKTTKPEKMEEWLSHPPIHYLLQLQTQLLLTNVEEGFLAVLESSFPFKLIVWKVRGLSKIHELIERETVRFWKCAEARKPFYVDKDLKIQVLENIYTGLELIHA